MAKNNQPQENSEQKVQTKYDRKMAERKEREQKEQREAKILRITAILIGVIIVAVIAGSIAAPIINKNKAVKDTYVTVGSHEITKLEYDYYFNGSVNNFLTTYSSLLAYMGLDTSKDLSEQQYSEELTWKDFFDQMTVDQIRQTKSLNDEAAANQFTYDDTEDYANALSGMQSAAESAGVSLEDYYKTASGTYATEKNMEPFVKEGLLATAYYQHLIEQNAPGEQEVKDYYAEHVQDYDKVNYRTFTFSADLAEDASEEETDQAMMAAKNKADAMMEARKGGAEFKDLCIENATEESKESYETTDVSLKEDYYYSSVPAAISGWLYEDGRTEGDLTVIEDMTGHQYYVVEFISRYYDEADDQKIADTIAGNKTAEYVNALMESYEVTDNKGELKYLTIDMSADTATEETETGDAE